MLSARTCLWQFVGGAIVGVALQPAWAESFLLKNGGAIEGELLNPKRREADPYEVRTPTGVLLSLARDNVSKVVVKKEIEREYERKQPGVPNTAEGHWEMAEWCREQGLRRQREFHLQQVVAHQPDHEPAHLALGHQRFDGKWQNPDDYMTAQGYVRYQGTWRTRQDVELARLQEERDAQVIKWRQQIRIWRSWLGKKRDHEAVTNLKQIRDPHAAPTLIEILEQKAPLDLRLLIVDVLGELKGNPAEGTFVKLAMTDKSQAIRDACLDHLVRTKSKAAVFAYIGVLKDPKAPPELIKLAGMALGRLEDPIATAPLIDALVTRHEVLIQTGTADTGGLGPISINNAGGFQAGAAKPIKRTINSENDQVLSALNLLHPGVNFGFNEAAWKTWYQDTFAPPQVNLRRGE